MSDKIVRDDVDKFFDYGIDISSQTLYMGSESEDENGETGVNYAMSERVIKGLHLLDRKVKNGITIIMNNIGGCTIHGMAIYDAIRACQNEVTIEVCGSAMSMGSLILQAADYRVMTPNSIMMIHYGQAGFHDHPRIVERWTREGKRFDTKMEDIFLDKIKDKRITLEKYLILINKEDQIPKGNAKNKLIEIDRDKLQSMLNFDTIFNAQDALELGLIDKIKE